MIAVKRALAPLTIALAVGAFASPSFAQSSPDHISAARAAATRQCSRNEERYPEHTWGNREYFEYLSCMTQHGQRE